MEIEVAVPTPVPGTFTYSCETLLPPGVRVMVPFGKRNLVGVVLASRPEGLAAGEGGGRPPLKPQKGRLALDTEEVALKPIAGVVDQAPVYSSVVLEIARWISQYYMHPLGEVLRTMLPASSAKTTVETYTLTPLGKSLMKLAESSDGELLRVLFMKREVLQGTTLKAKLKRLQQEKKEWARFDVKTLCDRGFISLARASSVKARVAKEGAVGKSGKTADRYREDPGISAEPPRLTAEQMVAFTSIREGLELSVQSEQAPKPYLLHGVTGSGKTEVYLRLIAEAMALGSGGGQALVLVPEISLTPQMTRVFSARFPGQIAVVHSAMSDGERWEQLERIRSGEAAILIGPRSAVFGPFANLRLLIVDEEHDSSYKQSSGLTYHGRDVAVLRARLEKATIVLGSATPALESYANALSGKYSLLELKERATGRPLPTIEILGSTPSFSRGQLLPPFEQLKFLARDSGAGGLDAGNVEIPIDDGVITALRATKEKGCQSVVLVNRRGYAFYLLSLTQKKSVLCPRCSISLTLHKRSSVLRCHYCDYSATLMQIIAERRDEQFVAVGYGSEKAEMYLRGKLPEAKIVRLDSDTVARRDVLPETLGKFRRGEIDILVGTQILAKGHDFPAVTLIAILEVDQLLDLPDFRAGERTFQLIVQAAGRAGRAERPGNVIIQCLRPHHPVVQAAIEQDYRTFAARELAFRRGQGYPPFARMIAVEFSSVDRARLSQHCERIEGWFTQMSQLKPELFRSVKILGPAVPPIEMIRGRHRRSLLFSAATIKPLHELVGEFCKVFGKMQGDLRIKIDVDPQSLI